MGEQAGTGERVWALTVLKLGGAAVTAASLTAAAAWAARRAKFEHTIGRFSDQVAFLESDAADHHAGVSRYVVAAALLRPEGATREQLRDELHRAAVDRRAMSTAIHALVGGGVLEKAARERQPVVRPTENFMLALLEDPARAPRLLTATRQLAGPERQFDFEDLRPHVISADVLDTTPFEES